MEEKAKISDFHSFKVFLVRYSRTYVLKIARPANILIVVVINRLKYFKEQKFFERKK